MTISTNAFFGEQLPALIKAKPAMFAGLKHNVQFDVSGTGGGLWAIDVNGGAHVINGRVPGAKTELKCSASTFDVLVSGRLTMRQAFQMSLLKVAGDVGLGLRLGAVFMPPAAAKVGGAA